jgi:hypothetical protein
MKVSQFGSNNTKKNPKQQAPEEDQDQDKEFNPNNSIPTQTKPRHVNQLLPQRSNNHITSDSSQKSTSTAPINNNKSQLMKESRQVG